MSTLYSPYYNFLEQTGNGTGTVQNVATGAGLTGGPITQTGVISLADITAGGSFTNANITVNTKGQVVAAANGTGGTGGAGTVTSVVAGTGLTGGTITTTGTVGLANTAVTAGTYNLATVTVNGQGQVTAASSGTVSGTGTVTSVAAGGGLVVGNSYGSSVTTTGTVSRPGYYNPIPTGGTGTYASQFTSSDGSGGLQTPVNSIISAKAGAIDIGPYIYSISTPVAIMPKVTATGNVNFQMFGTPGSAYFYPGSGLIGGGGVLYLSSTSVMAGLYVPSPTTTQPGNPNNNIGGIIEDVSIWSNVGGDPNSDNLAVNNGILFGGTADGTLNIAYSGLMLSRIGSGGVTCAIHISTHTYPDSCTISNCFANSCSYGIVYDPGLAYYFNRITGCNLADNSRHGLALGIPAAGYALTGTDPSGLMRIDNNMFINNGGTASTMFNVPCNVYLGCPGSYFNDNTVTKSGGHGLYVVASGVTIVGNLWYNNGQAITVDVNPVTDISIVGNCFKILGSGLGAAVNINIGCSYVNISGNTFNKPTNSNTRACVYLADLTGAYVTNHTISNNTFNTPYAIYIGANQQKVYIGANTYSQGASVTIAANAANNTIVLVAGMSVIDNGTGTILLNYLLVTQGLVTVSGTPTGQIQIGGAAAASAATFALFNNDALAQTLTSGAVNVINWVQVVSSVTTLTFASSNTFTNNTGVTHYYAINLNVMVQGGGYGDYVYVKQSSNNYLHMQGVYNGATGSATTSGVIALPAGDSFQTIINAGAPATSMGGNPPNNLCSLAITQIG